MSRLPGPINLLSACLLAVFVGSTTACIHKSGSAVVSAEVGTNTGGLVGTGVAMFHLYDGVDKCTTALGLDPKAFGMMAVAASTRIHDQLPKLLKVGKRGGPYDSTFKCIDVTAPSTQKSVQVRIIDKCCGESLADPTSHQLDLSQEAFAQLASPDKGRLDVRWQVIDCPVELQVKNDDAVCNDDYYFNP